jgi:hypothetical protein
MDRPLSYSGLRTNLMIISIWDGLDIDLVDKCKQVSPPALLIAPWAAHIYMSLSTPWTHMIYQAHFYSDMFAAHDIFAVCDISGALDINITDREQKVFRKNRRVIKQLTDPDSTRRHPDRERGNLLQLINHV